MCGFLDPEKANFYVEHLFQAAVLHRALRWSRSIQKEPLPCQLCISCDVFICYYEAKTLK